MQGDQSVMELNFFMKHYNEMIVILDENFYLLAASRQCESPLHYPAKWLT